MKNVPSYPFFPSFLPSSPDYDSVSDACPFCAYVFYDRPSLNDLMIQTENENENAIDLVCVSLYRGDFDDLIGLREWERCLRERYGRGERDRDRDRRL